MDDGIRGGNAVGPIEGEYGYSWCDDQGIGRGRSGRGEFWQEDEYRSGEGRWEDAEWWCQECLNRVEGADALDEWTRFFFVIADVFFPLFLILVSPGALTTHNTITDSELFLKYSFNNMSRDEPLVAFSTLGLYDIISFYSTKTNAPTNDTDRRSLHHHLHTTP
jgi:hypothetical protein